MPRIDPTTAFRPIRRASGASSAPPAWLSALVSFATTCLILLPIEYRMAAETALMTIFPRHF